MKLRTLFSTALLTALFLASFTLLSAQTPTPTPGSSKAKEDDEVIKVSSRLIVVPISVVDANGNPVTGLKAEDFRLKEENRPQLIDSVGNAETVPLEIALLFDISATTSPMFKFQQETAAKFLREVMKPSDRATIYTVGAKPVLVQARETAEKSIEAVMAITTTKEFTAFYDSVSAAAEFLNTRSPEGTRRVMVVISDGEDTNSARIARAIQAGYAKADVNTLDTKSLYQLTVAKRDEASLKERVLVSKSLQNADTVFYSINPAGSSFQLNKMSVFGQENMQRFADETGGNAFLPKFLPIDTKDTMQNSSNMKKNTDVLERIFRELANSLRAQYLIQYYSDADYPENKFIKLDVSLQNPGGSKVRARQGYYPKGQ